MAIQRPVQPSALIRSLANQMNLDPAAVLAVASTEGGLVNRANDVGDLAGGGSYGPFQLYTQGALPAQYRGNPTLADQWAWSPQGIKYALGRMVASGAAGLRGNAAINTIVRKFERPADPNSQVAKALARYGQFGGAGGAALGQSAPGLSRPITPAQSLSTPSVRTSNPARSALLQGLAAGNDVYDLLPQLIAARGNPTPTPSMPLRTAPMAPQGAPKPAPMPVRGEPANIKVPTTGSHVNTSGFKPSFAQKLAALTAASGGRIKVSSGYRPPEQQAQLFAAAVKKYGSEAAARKWVAPPGKSRHGHGDAADISGDLAWLKSNAHRFGLHLPMSWEPWHIEEIGSR